MHRGSGEELKAIGFDGYLQRPVFKPQLQHMIEAFSDQINTSPSRRFLYASSLETANKTSISLAMKNTRILLAEDNSVNQMVGQKILNNLVAEIDMACNGQEAVRMWSKFSYDAIILDCHMPIMDSYQATKNIRQIENHQHHTPIIALTANALSGEREICLQIGMDDYVTKPIHAETLVTAINHCLQSNRLH
ncbi:MAG: response regulator [Pseudomonadales bacterium]|nr:response regulator [Pseudomonadales bacterium]